MIAIKNGRVITITEGTLECGTVLVEGGRIVAIDEVVEIPEDAEVYDATGKVVMPGLIDAHCHVGLFPDGIGWEYADGNEMTDPVTPHLRALDAVHPDDQAFKELVAAGVTTVLTGPGQRQPDRRSMGLHQDGPQAERGADGVAGTGRYEDGAGREPQAGLRRSEKDALHPHGERRQVAGCVGGGAELSGKMGAYTTWKRQSTSPERAMPSVPKPPERDLKLEALGQVLRREMKARVHAHRADDMLTAIRIAEEFDLDLTLEHATEGYKIADMLAAKGIPVTAGRSSFRAPSTSSRT